MIQDQRVISTTAVRCVGNTLILQGRVYRPPYVISAIGDRKTLQAALDADPAVRIYREWVDAVGLGYDVQTTEPAAVPRVHRAGRAGLHQPASAAEADVRALERRPSGSSASWRSPPGCCCCSSWSGSWGSTESSTAGRRPTSCRPSSSDFADVPHRGWSRPPGPAPRRLRREPGRPETVRDPADPPARAVRPGPSRSTRASGWTCWPRGWATTPGRQLPGEVGNVAIAGHRAGHGQPAHRHRQDRAGRRDDHRDRGRVVRLQGPALRDRRADRHRGPGAGARAAGREPDAAVVHSDQLQPASYGSSHRYIVFSLFDTFYPRAQGLPPALLADPNAAA